MNYGQMRRHDHNLDKNCRLRRTRERVESGAS